MKSELCIVGAGGHARVVADAARESDRWSAIRLFDSTFPDERSSGDWAIDGSAEDLLQAGPQSTRQVIIGSGDNVFRLQWHTRFDQAGWSMASVFHPAATLSRQCHVGNGSVVLAGAVINFASRIGAASIINSGAIIEHDCQLAEAVHVSPGAILSGKARVGKRSWIGAGAVIIQGCSVGQDSIIGAGSTVIHDIADNVTAVGSPARPLHQADCLPFEQRRRA